MMLLIHCFTCCQMSCQNNALLNLMLDIPVIDAAWRVIPYIVATVLVLLGIATAASYLWKRKQSGEPLSAVACYRLAGLWMMSASMCIRTPLRACLIKLPDVRTALVQVPAGVAGAPNWHSQTAPTHLPASAHASSAFDDTFLSHAH